MNNALRSTFARTTAHLYQLRNPSFFHSTPPLERKRKPHSHSRFNYYARRMRKFETKKKTICNLSDYAEYLFKSWQDENTMSSSREQDSWFTKPSWVRGGKKTSFQEFEWEPSRNKGRMFDFCTRDDDSDDDVETIFRTSFGGVRFTYCSFDGQSSYRNSRSWRYESEYESDTDSQSNLASERQALGLNAYGPLKLEEVKDAYRTCALRWHPDRHQGLAKVQAEEKFKHCSAAYKTLCDSLVAC